MTIIEAKRLLFEIQESSYEPTDWECEFLHSIGHILDQGFTLTEKQAACLERIRGKVGDRSSYNKKKEQTPYEVLGIKESASDAEIKKAYQKLALSNHPDKVAQLDPEIIKFATERMQRINAAYEVLTK